MSKMLEEKCEKMLHLFCPVPVVAPNIGEHDREADA